MVEIYAERVDCEDGRLCYEIKASGELIATVHEPDRSLGKPLVRWGAKALAEACVEAIRPLVREAQGGRRHG